MSKRRVEWNVRLKQSNYLQSKGKLVPQVLLARTWTLDEIVTRITTSGGCALNAETLRCAAGLLLNEMEDCLLEGSAVSTSLGTLTPSVTGTWSTIDRLQPEVRQQNTATVRYTLSPQMKKALANPLFHEASGTGFRLSIYSVQDTASRTEDECLTPGRTIILRGHMHITPSELVLNTRGRIIAQVPDDLPPGEYLIRIVSQCTTSPQPMKQAAEYITQTPLRLLEKSILPQ
jgi:DNA-binding domain/Domain of unknown function (DUF4469) with IG-like fold